MNLNKFKEELLKLGYEVITNSQFELEGGKVYTGLRLTLGDIRCYIVPGNEFNMGVKIAVLKNETKGIEIDLIGNGDNSYMRVYDVLSQNSGLFQDRGNLVTISGDLNMAYSNVSDGVNKVDIQYDGECITYRGVASESDVKHVLETVLEGNISTRNRAVDIGTYYLVKASEIKNETEVEDIEDILKQIKVYLVRADERNRALHLEDILRDVKEDGTYYDSAQSIVMRIYRTPIYEEDRKVHPFGEELKESSDKKDNQRVRRFAEYLSQNKEKYNVRYKIGNIKGIPFHLLLEVRGIRLVIAPTFVISPKGNKVIYNKHKEDKGYEVLQKQLNILMKEDGIKRKEDVEVVYTIIKAYITSNDLRKTVR